MLLPVAERTFWKLAMLFWLCDSTLGPELCQAKASKLAAGSAGRKANRKFEANLGLKLVSRQFRKQRLALWAAAAVGPIHPSLPWCFGSATPPSDPSCARRKQASWQTAVQEGRQIEGLKLVICCIEGLKLVSRQFRKQRLARWAAGRGPNPSFTAMVFWLPRTRAVPDESKQAGSQQCRKASK